MKAKCKTKTAPMKPERKNEIVVYQPDKTLRLEVKLEDETGDECPVGQSPLKRC